jgi:hypothetical protein
MRESDRMTSVGTVLRVAEFRRRLYNGATSNQFHQSALWI